LQHPLIVVCSVIGFRATMSVWDVPHHRDDALLYLLTRFSPRCTSTRVIKALANFEVGDACGKPTPLQAGTATTQLTHSYRGYHKFFKQTGERASKLMTTTLDYYEHTKHEIRFGLRAVYDIAYEAYYRGIRYENEIDMSAVKTFTSRLVRNALTAGHWSPNGIAATIKNTESVFDKKSHMLHLLQSAATFDHLLSFANLAEYQDASSKAARDALPMPSTADAKFANKLNFGKPWTARIVNGVIFLEKNSAKNPTVYVLIPKDIHRLTDLLNAMAQTHLYASIETMGECLLDPAGHMVRMLTKILDAMINAPNPNKVARYFDVLLHSMLASWATDKTTVCVKAMRAKYVKENLHEVRDINADLAWLSCMPKRLALEVSKVYKMLPCPDFDSYAGFAVQCAKQTNKNPWFENPGAGISEADFETWRRYQALLAHGSVPKQVRLSRPLYDNVGAATEFGQETVDRVEQHLVAEAYPSINANQMTWMKMDGLYSMVKFDAVVPECLKDKSLCPSNISPDTMDDIRREVQRWETNYLLTHLKQPRPLTSEQAMTVIHEVVRKYFHMVFFKAETKKDDPRNCYSGQDVARKALSQLEASVFEILKNRRGNANGVADYEVYNSVAYALQGSKDNVLSISFDIAGFSPNLNTAATLSSLRKWSELFADERVSSLHRIFTNGVAVWNHGPIMQTHALQGTDLEGYLGRINTDFHIDVMSYALKILSSRMKSHHSSTIKRWAEFAPHLFVMIDDGLLILQFSAVLGPVSNMPSEVVDYILKVIEEVYAACSMKLSWDKTLVSARVMTFLNEVWVDGNHIANGLRAFLRIRPDRDQIPLDFEGSANRFVAMAQGAIKSGASLVSCLVACAYQLALQLTRVKSMPKEWPKVLADVFMLPTPMGGCAFPSATQLGAAVAGDTDAMACGNIIRIAATIPDFAPLLVKTLDLKAAPNPAITTLRNPSSYNLEAPRLRSTVLPNAITKAMSQFTRNFAIRQLLNLDLNPLAESALQQLGSYATPEAVTRLYKGTPIATVDRLLDKFKRASSVLTIVPRRFMRLARRDIARKVRLVAAFYAQ